MPKSSDSDSDDSHDARLREAAVTVEDIKKESQKVVYVKNKNDDNDNEHDNGFKIDVTPEFQSFVAKKLTKILDEFVLIK